MKGKSQQITALTLLFSLLSACSGQNNTADSGDNIIKDHEVSSTASNQITIKNISAVFSNKGAFAAIKNDGTVVSWGHAMYGGDSTSVRDDLINIEHITGSLGGAFAALRKDGSVITWGHPSAGGDSTLVAKHLNSTKQIVASKYAFAAILESGAVVTWGTGPASQIEEISAQLQDVKSVVATHGAFAALTSSGTVITWGEPDLGGDSSVVDHQLTDIKTLTASVGAFAALKNDGSVVVWGGKKMGADLSTSGAQLTGIRSIVGNGGINWDDLNGAFTALKNDGSVIPWGAMQMGGDVCYSFGGRRTCGFPEDIYQNISNADLLFSSPQTFVTQAKDGTVKYWGSSNGAFDFEQEKIKSIAGTDKNTVALTETGNVFMWPELCVKNVQPPQGACATNAKQIATTSDAVAVLHNDGHVITWGNGIKGGDARDLSSISTDASDIQGDQGFTALDHNGKIIQWNQEKRVFNNVDFYQSLNSPNPIQSIAWGGKIFITADNQLAYNNFDPSLYVNNHLTTSLENSHSTPLKNIRHAYNGAFSNGAAIHLDGTVSTWGSYFGGNSNAVSDQLYDIKSLTPSERGFAGIRTDGSVVSWASTAPNNKSYDLISGIKNTLSSVKSINATYSDFIALTDDGKVISWPAQIFEDGIQFSYEDPTGSVTKLNDVESLSSNAGAVAALLSDGSIEAWGRTDFGGNTDRLIGLDGFTHIVASRYNPGLIHLFDGGAFAALNSNGTVKTWGHEKFGGDSESVQEHLIDIKAIYATESAFAALSNNGLVVTWGNPNNGGDSSLVQKELYDIDAIYSSLDAFIAKRKDGRLISWGNTRSLNPH